MPKITETDYPNNLIRALFETYEDTPLSEDQKAGLDKALSMLTEREQTVIKERYQNGCVYVDIGKKFNVTQERIRQINMKALRKLRNPKYSCYIINGFQTEERKTKLREMEKNLDRCPFCGGYPDLVPVNDESDIYLIRCRCGIRTETGTYSELTERWNKRFYRIISARNYNSEDKEEKPAAILSNFSEMKIEELDLSVRAYNCLKRAGFTCVEELIERLDEDPNYLTKVRNLGVHSKAEVEKTLWEKVNYKVKGEMI